MGSFGQTRGSHWAKFAGVLNEPEFHQIHDEISGMRKAGRAGMARSLGRTKAGYKHKGGDTRRDEELRKQSELIADQQNEIDELKNKEPLPTIEQGTDESDMPIGPVDEGDFIVE
jgi:hypothetical protein